MILLKKIDAVMTRTLFKLTALSTVILCSNILSACGNTNSTVCVKLSADALTSATRLTGDTVLVTEKKIYSAMYAGNGKIVTVNKGDRSIEIIDLKTGKLTDSLPNYGAEDNIFISDFSRIHGDTLEILDAIKHQVAYYNLDSLAIIGAEYSPSIREFNIDNETTVFSNVLPYGDRLLGLNPYCFKSQDGKIDNGDSRRFIISDSTLTFHTDKYKFQTLNVSQGSVIVHPERYRLAYLSPYDDILEIWEYSPLKKLYEITGPADIPNDYLILDGGMIAVSSPSNRAYKTGTATAEWLLSIFTLNNEAYIVKIDWDGTLLDSYCLGTIISPLAMSLSEDGKNIYLLQFLPDDRRALIRYRI